MIEGLPSQQGEYARVVRVRGAGSVGIGWPVGHLLQQLSGGLHVRMARQSGGTGQGSLRPAARQIRFPTNPGRAGDRESAPRVLALDG